MKLISGQNDALQQRAFLESAIFKRLYGISVFLLEYGE